MFEKPKSIYKDNDTETKVKNESVEDLILHKLDTLAIEYRISKQETGLKYTFLNVKRIDDNAFVLDTQNDKKIVLHTLHFNEGELKHPDDYRAITAKELLEFLVEKFPDADNFVVSSCYVDDARQKLRDINNDKIILLGSGLSEYKVMYYKKKNQIDVFPSKHYITKK